MSKLDDINILGELWMRTPSGKILPSNVALSSLYLKYSTIYSPIYFDLENNAIKRFDCFYDVVFIETQNGFIFDKIKHETNELYPADNDNRFISTTDGNNSPDYWLDEVNKKIYVVYNNLKRLYGNIAEINVTIHQFDIIKNTYLSKLSYTLTLTFCDNYYLEQPYISKFLEPPKISYNLDTRCFDVSFILRGSNKEFGLISTNLKKKDVLDIDSINCFIPYSTLQSITVNVDFNKSLETDFYS
jgi:hypothetical protein